MSHFNRTVIIVSILVTTALGCGLTDPSRSNFSTAVPNSRVTLQPCKVQNIKEEARCGTYEVFEDRKAKTGRKIPLNIIVLPALNATPAPDPVLWLHGGPGAAATDTAAAAVFSYLAQPRK